MRSSASTGCSSARKARAVAFERQAKPVTQKADRVIGAGERDGFEDLRLVEMPGESRPGRLGSEEGRQLRRELAERARDAEGVSEGLEASGAGSSQARALAARISGLSAEHALNDPLGLAALTAQVADDIKMLEYALRREADSDRPTLQLSGSEELPPGYRAMVEEYYRTLARKPRK